MSDNPGTNPDVPGRTSPSGSPLSGRSLRIVRILLCLAVVPLELAALYYGQPPKEGLPIRCHLWLPLPMAIWPSGLPPEIVIGVAVIQFPVIVGGVCFLLGRYQWRKVLGWTFVAYVACVLASFVLFPLFARLQLSKW